MPKRVEPYLECDGCHRTISTECEFVAVRGTFYHKGCEGHSPPSVKVRVSIPIEMDQSIQRLVQTYNHHEPESNTKGRILRHLLKIGLSKVEEQPPTLAARR